MGSDIVLVPILRATAGIIVPHDDELSAPCISFPSDNASSTDVSLTVVASLAVLQDRHFEAAGGIVVTSSNWGLAAKRRVRMKVAVGVVVEPGRLAKSQSFHLE